MKALVLSIAIFSIVRPSVCIAEIDVNSFSFKGVKFGDSWSIGRVNSESARLEPWDRDWSNLPQVHSYPRIWERYEKDRTRLVFGEFPLSSITYRYFDRKLFEIYVLFGPTIGCGSIDEVNKMLEVRYTVRFDEKYLNGKERYQGLFANKSVAIEVKCDQSILALYGEQDAGERVISIVFRDVNAYKQSQAHMLDTIDKRAQESKEAIEKK